MLEKIYREAGLPKDLFKVLLISHDQSNDVIENDLIRGVTLTGSPEQVRSLVKKQVLPLKNLFWN